MFLTGISKSGFGAGIEMLAVPVMALFIVPQQAAAIMLPILCVIDLANLWRYRNDWVKRVLILLLPAALVGIGIGAITFSWLNADMFRLGLGLLALGFVALQIVERTRGLPNRKPGRVLTALMGATSGFTSFVAHAGGPPVKIVLLSENLPKEQYVGTNSYLFFAINYLKLVPYFYLGQFTVENLTTSLWLAPFIPLGVGMGFWLNQKVSQEIFTRLAFIALALAGMKLSWDGLWGLGLMG